MDDLLQEIRERAGRRERVLVTTLTKRMAEDLTSTIRSWASRFAICIPTSRRSSGSKFCETFGEVSSTFWWGSISFGKGWICRKFRWWPSWMRTRKDFSGRPVP